MLIHRGGGYWRIGYILARHNLGWTANWHSYDGKAFRYPIYAPYPMDQDQFVEFVLGIQLED